MASLKRLPRGYRAKVKEVKDKLLKAVDNLNKSTLALDKQMEWIRSIYKVSNVYTDANIGHIAFDCDFIGTEFLYDFNSCRFRLYEKCTVFIDGTEDFVDNYKW